ncbi:MAG: class I adenylate-forming enzyme family protein [Pseudomonadota bacterium]
MPSVLDTRMDAVTGRLASPDGPMAVSMIEIGGVNLPMISVAPPALSHYFAYFCAQHGDKEFLVDGDERLSFAQVYVQASQVAKALVSGYGVKRGDRVGIAARNAPSWIILYMAILMAGGVATLLNGWWQGSELADGIDDVGVTLLFTDTQRAKRLNEANRVVMAEMVVIDLGLPTAQALAHVIAKGAQDAVLPEITSDDLATILFTSGSTGQSKGAYSTHRAVVQGTFNYILQAMGMLELAVEDGLEVKEGAQPATLLSVPLFHVTGAVPLMLVSFAVGRKIVMMPKWDALKAMDLIQREKITNFTGVPLMSFEIMTHPERHKFDLSTLQGLAGGGAPRPVDHVRRLAEEFPTAPPALGYGLTETNAVGCGNYGQNYIDKPNSTGRASAPLVDLAILDDDGKPVPQGERGEVSIRTVANFSGYWNRPEATAEALTADGYFRTGDLGYLDPDGYLYIVDRKKDIIIRGGENISCQEVEAAIYEHAAIAECAVFGLPDERLGEVVGAIAYCHPGQSVTVEALNAFLGERLAAFKVPLRMWFSPDPLPRLGTEKVDKVALRKVHHALWEAEQKA